MFKLVLEKADKPEIKLPRSVAATREATEMRSLSTAEEKAPQQPRPSATVNKKIVTKIAEREFKYLWEKERHLSLTPFSAGAIIDWMVIN